ncbi:NUDIX hydrolase [Actinoallomurus sp. CA-150999]|uniref:NUDIX hydrolase n=1 Tax=Actinoallomurus sp. CA-150999 TaxID=3239887 RepID=UPI003D8F4FB9
MAKQTVFSGKIFSIVWDERLNQDGSTSVFETVNAPDVVRVYPVRGDSIWLIREYRRELDRDILRTVSGRIEQGESPEQAGRRELREELGGMTTSMTTFATSRPILKVDSVVHHVLADMPEIGPSSPEPDERIRPAVYQIEQLESLVWEGHIIEDVIAMQLLRIARDPAMLRFG